MFKTPTHTPIKTANASRINITIGQWINVQASNPKPAIKAKVARVVSNINFI